MIFYKKFFVYLFAVLLFFSAGCSVKNISSDGLTLRVTQSELNSHFKDFPIEKDYVFANIRVEKPKLFIKKGSKRINASMDTFVSAVMIPEKSGSFSISGIPYFNQKTKSIYLKNIHVEKFQIQDAPITKELANLLLSNLRPVIDNIFKKFPIYKVEKTSFLGNKVKNIKIEDGELLLHFR